MKKATKKILIISAYAGSYSTKRLVAEIEARKDAIEGIELRPEVISGTDMYAFISQTKTEKDLVFQRGEVAKALKLDDYLAVIPRIAGYTVFDFGCMIVQHLNENLNIFSTSSEFGLKICSNKFKNAQFLSRRGIRVPKQVLAHVPTDYKELFEMIGGLPVVAKLQRGSQGSGVFILNDELAATTALRSMENLGVDVVLQQMIDSGKPANDLRVFVIGAETKKPKIFAFKRYSVDDDFRSNYSLSGLGEKVEITDEEKEMALKASKYMHLGVCGVDIMRATNEKNKPYMIETNGSPSLHGIETVTGENIAGAIIDYVLENYQLGGYRGVRDNIQRLKQFIEVCGRAQEGQTFLDIKKRQEEILNELELMIEQ